VEIADLKVTGLEMNAEFGGPCTSIMTEWGEECLASAAFLTRCWLLLYGLLNNRMIYNTEVFSSSGRGDWLSRHSMSQLKSLNSDSNSKARLEMAIPLPIFNILSMNIM
jgi:hypothetical protein